MASSRMTITYSPFSPRPSVDSEPPSATAARPLTAIILLCAVLPAKVSGEGQNIWVSGIRLQTAITTSESCTQHPPLRNCQADGWIRSETLFRDKAETAVIPPARHSRSRHRAVNVKSVVVGYGVLFRGLTCIQHLPQHGGSIHGKLPAAPPQIPQSLRLDLGVLVPQHLHSGVQRILGKKQSVKETREMARRDVGNTRALGWPREHAQKNPREAQFWLYFRNIQQPQGGSVHLGPRGRKGRHCL